MPALLIVLASLTAYSAHPACDRVQSCEAMLNVTLPQKAQACVFRADPKLNDTDYDRCIRFVDGGKRIAPPDGMYAMLPKGGKKANNMAVEHGFLLPLTGNATLENGTPVAFFQQDAFNLNGNRVYLQSPEGGWGIAPNGDYTLATGQAFEVEDGFISSAFYDSASGRIQHESRD